MEKTENRRRYFRINDVVDLNYRIIDEKDVTESSNQIIDNVLNDCSLPTALEIVSQDSARLLHRIEKNQPDMAQYLRLLDKKIDLLAQAIQMQGFQTGKQNTCEINLSASGLAFNSDKAFIAGVYFELSMLLVSIRVMIVTCGQVIQCKKITHDDGTPRYLISVDFLRMREQDRELLIQHMVKKQMQQIREKRKKQ